MQSEIFLRLMIIIEFSAFYELSLALSCVCFCTGFQSFSLPPLDHLPQSQPETVPTFVALMCELLASLFELRGATGERARN